MSFVCVFFYVISTCYYGIGRKKWEYFFCFVVSKNWAIGFDFVEDIDMESWMSRCWRLLRSGAVVVATGLEGEFFYVLTIILYTGFKFLIFTSIDFGIT